MTDIAKQSHRIETPRGHLYAECWSPRKSRGVPIVLLHDSLGCVELWRDFPLRLAQSCGREVIAYDRLGFGRSSACLVNLTPSFIEDEAHGDFQAVREYFELSQFVVFGHSVGGGMAVGCAAAHPQACHGLITESAQAAVDNAILDGIRSAARRFALPGQMERLQQYHGKKAEWVLRSWVDTWLSEEFRQWNLDRQLAQVQCSALVLHGDRDEYGTRHHPERLCAGISRAPTLHMLENCGRLPHREYPDQVLAATSVFLAKSAGHLY